MSRTSDKELQQQALEMVRKGTLQKDIAKKLQVSERTIRRWVQGNKEVNILITPATEEKPPTTPIEVVARISTAQPDEPIHITFPYNNAMRLLTLTEKTLDMVEETLDDPDYKRSDKLRAAQLVGSWVNLGYQRKEPYNYKTIAAQVAKQINEIFNPPLEIKTPPVEDTHQKRLELIELLGELPQSALVSEFDIGLDEIRNMTDIELDEILAKLNTDEDEDEETELAEHWKLHMCTRRSNLRRQPFDQYPV